MSLNPVDWRRRFIQQATWTQSIRDYLYKQVGLEQAQLVLDVGCGPGALEGELQPLVRGRVVGLDIDREYLYLAKQFSPGCEYIQGDAHQLPFEREIFDGCLCHFVLLWLKEPLPALQEMHRVVRQKGWVLILAEPDYAGRIDFPQELEQLGVWQRQSLQEQGADISIGRQLMSLCLHAGLKEVQSGVLGGQWTRQTNNSIWKNEQAVLLSDISQLHKPPEPGEVTDLLNVDRLASEKGERILFVPTFYAWGRKG